MTIAVYVTYNSVSYTHLDVYKRQIFLKCRNYVLSRCFVPPEPKCSVIPTTDRFPADEL